MLLHLHVRCAPVLVDPVLVFPRRGDVLAVLVIEQVGLHRLDVMRQLLRHENRTGTKTCFERFKNSKMYNFVLTSIYVFDALPTSLFRPTYLSGPEHPTMAEQI